LSATGNSSTRENKTVQEALRRYAKQSPINDLRVRWLYGIKTKISNADMQE